MDEPGGTSGACGPQHRLAGLVAPFTARTSATRPLRPVPVGGRAPASRVTVAAPARRVAGLRPAGAPRTAFVLAGGAALGAMQAGMLHALYERGIVPDLLVGTSAGALNAAYVASRPQTVATARGLAAVWCGLRRKDVFPLRPATLLPGLTGRSDHLAPDRGLRRLANRHLQITRLEDASIPLHLIAWDLLSGQEARLSEGLTIEAVPAAAASALTHLLSARLQADLARYAATAEIIALPAANPQSISLTSFSHAPQLIAQALTAARAALAAHDAHPARARAS